MYGLGTADYRWLTTQFYPVTRIQDECKKRGIFVRVCFPRDFVAAFSRGVDSVRALTGKSNGKDEEEARTKCQNEARANGESSVRCENEAQRRTKSKNEAEERIRAETVFCVKDEATAKPQNDARLCLMDKDETRSNGKNKNALCTQKVPRYSERITPDDSESLDCSVTVKQKPSKCAMNYDSLTDTAVLLRGTIPDSVYDILEAAEKSGVRNFFYTPKRNAKRLADDKCAMYRFFLQNGVPFAKTVCADGTVLDGEPNGKQGAPSAKQNEQNGVPFAKTVCADGTILDGEPNGKQGAPSAKQNEQNAAPDSELCHAVRSASASFFAQSKPQNKSRAPRAARTPHTDWRALYRFLCAELCRGDQNGAEVNHEHKSARGFIAKPRFGSLGRGVVFIQSESELKTALTSCGGELIFQEFIQTYPARDFFTPQNSNAKSAARTPQNREASAPRDVRVFVCGGKVIVSVERLGAPNAVTSNAHTGGTVKPIAVSDTMADAARAVIAKSGLWYGTADFLIPAVSSFYAHNGGENTTPCTSFYLCEINASPGFEGIETATGINIAGALIDSLTEQLA